MKSEVTDSKNIVFKRIAFVLLLLLAFELPILVLTRVHIYDVYTQRIASGDTTYSLSEAIEESMMGLYKYNCTLCIVSLLVQICYWGGKAKKGFKQFKAKEFFSKNWPCILLAIFMAWTSIGCIKAGMEMDAELTIKRASSIENVSDRIVKIAAWSSGDRMNNTKDIYQNAKDRAWHGCKNLKDGYFSFMFYATVLLNVLMLGVGSKNYKKWLIRSLLISSFIVGFLSLLAFFRYSLFSGIIYFDRGLFNNRNHFGYYISVILIMSVCSFISEKNYFFKPFALLNTVLYTWLLFACNTFGSYLGAMFAMAFLGIVMLIGTISFLFKKDVTEEEKEASQFSIPKLIQYFVCLAVFLFMTFSFVKTENTTKLFKMNILGEEAKIRFDYSYLMINLGESTYRLSFNTMDDDIAEAYGIKDKKIDGAIIPFGKKITKLENKYESFVKREFVNKFKDFSKLMSFFKQEEVKPIASGEKSGEVSVSGSVISGEAKEIKAKDFIDTLAGLPEAEAYQKIFDKYPKVEGETLEQYQARLTAMENDVAEYKARYGGQQNSNTQELSMDDLSNVGSGRAPVWIRSLDLMNQRPWFGWGLENLLNEFYYQYNISEGRTHNLVLQLGATTGIPGVLLYLVAAISIWLKALFDAKFKEYKKMQLCIIGAVYLVATIVLNIIVSSIIDKLFFNGVLTVLLWAILTLLFFVRKVHLRIGKWNAFELMSATVFVSYMISSLFGNSAFYTSPYFMIFLGLLTHEALYKSKDN